MDIELYGFWRSIASFRVRVALKLKNIPFREIPIDILSGEQFTADYDAVNAERVVPTLVHDGYRVFQSLAILEYLDEVGPEAEVVADGSGRPRICAVAGSGDGRRRPSAGDAAGAQSSRKGIRRGWRRNHWMGRALGARGAGKL
jgi:Glutathione S-transferase, N-terminal domain